jgi:hypothetical protein
MTLIVTKYRRILLIALCFAAFYTTLVDFSKVYIEFGVGVTAIVDFRAFITAADIIKNGEIQYLYDLPCQVKWQAMRFNNYFPINETNLIVYVYPPWISALLRPLGGMPLPAAYLAMLFSNIMALLCCMVLMRRLLKGYTTDTWIFTGFIISSPITAYTLVNAQFSFWLLFGFLGCWHHVRKNNQILAGLSLGFLLIKPYLLFLPCLYIGFTRQWRVFFGLFFMGMLFLFFAVYTGGWDSIKAWLILSKTISRSPGLYGVHPEVMHTIRGNLHFFCNTLLLKEVFLYWAAAAGTTTIICICSIRQASKKKEKDLDPVWGILAAGSLLISPHAYYHDLILLVPCYMIIFFNKFSKYNMVFLTFGITSSILVWGCEIWAKIPGNLITVPVMTVMLLSFAIQCRDKPAKV